MFGPLDQYKLNPDRGYTPPPEANMQTYRTLATTLGIERMVIVHPTPYGADHSCTIDAIEQFGKERARGIAVITDQFPPSKLRELANRSFCGARINSITANGAGLDQVQAIVRMIEGLGWHLEFYIRPEELVRVADMLNALPVPFVIDHMGKIPANRGTNSTEFQTLLRLLGSGKGWVKLCGYRVSVQGPPYADLLEPARALIDAAPSRCIWGTDWPHPGLSEPPDAGKLLDLLYDWAPKPEQIRRILVDNPARLYGF
jgi:predicted TIM-barrel fold metal-dependent hydrolase